jgi:hypothetical protein
MTDLSADATVAVEFFSSADLIVNPRMRAGHTSETAPPKSPLAILATLSPLDEDFPVIEDPVPAPFDL